MSKLFMLVVVIINCFPLCKNERNNVCQTICGYADIDNDPNCWYNPDVCSSTEETITRRGYPFESYNIRSNDGYKNVLFRVPHNNTHQNKTRWPILLRGGIGGGPQTFLYIGNRSLVFYLVNNGFDVWLSNRRGTFFSTNDKHFWDFSFHETGSYDIKSEINFIRKKTKHRKKIILLGFSMGTTEMYIYATLKTKHSRKNVSGIISVAPIAFLGHCKGLAPKIAPLAKLIEGFLRANKIYALFNEKNASETTNMRTSFQKIVFSKYLMFAITGNDSGQINSADLPRHMCKSTPTSIKQLTHYAQIVNSGGKFRQYNYGIVKNILKYKSLQPPLYNVSKIKVPMHLFYGEADFLSTPEDVLKLYNALTIKNKSMTRISTDGKVKFNHVDFTLARNITTLFYEVLLNTINENLKG